MTEEARQKLGTRIVPRIIQDEMKQSYLDYSMSVIVGRALPDVRDGLKPVHRRVLYAMWESSLMHDKPFRKSAFVVGRVLSAYHPHGDAAVYDTMTRLAQDFSLRYPLIDGQGNWGSIDGDSAAAMRYCVTGDSLIVTEKGLLRIDEISTEENININVLSKDKKINKSSKWFDSGYHPTIKITTNKGYYLTGSKNHPVLTLNRDETGKPVFLWKLLENIEKGDFVIIDRSVDTLWPKENLDLSPYYPKIKKTAKVRILPKYLNMDLAYILGSFISEGSLTDIKIEFCNCDEKWVDNLSEKWIRLFPDSRLHKFKKKPSSYGKKEYFRLECHCRYTLEFLRNIGLEPVKSAEKIIPKVILKSPEKIVAIFLNAYFEGDGGIDYSSKMAELSCCSASEKLLSELQIVLLRFGIESAKRYDKYRFIHRLFIRGKRNVTRFYKDIGFFSERKKRKLEFVVLNYKKDYSVTDYVPFISNFVRNLSHNEFVIKHNFDRYSSMEKNYKQIASILLKKTKSDYSSIFEYFLTYNYLFEPIAKIENAGIQKVYSIKVESDCHSFISNGFVSHNTEAKLAPIAMELLEDLELKKLDLEMIQ